MNCAGCQYLGRNCGGSEGDPRVPTVDPLSLSSQQLLEIACTIARIGTVICDLGRVSPLRSQRPEMDEPYIWDIKED